MTIDGEDAKDLDDAITLRKEGEQYILGVHIADVSHYVTEYSALDDEAYNRATSVYLVDRVIPMLPRRLSNGICSLNQGEDRLALSCIMTINPDGKIDSYEIAETVINVDRRMTYTEVNAVIEHDEEAEKRNEGYVDFLNLMYELSHILRKRRNHRGAVNFETRECNIELNAKGKPVSITPYIRNRATKIIEDFMLAANETVAENFYWQDIPFVYRNHEEPDPKKMKALSLFASNFGYHLKTSNGKMHPKELQKLLAQVEDTPEESLISRMMLRSMQRAVYEPYNKGHYGLSAKYYCHFTSPIRRYPDLQIHRIIKQSLHGEMNDEKINHYKNILDDVTKHCSINERRADDAERDTEKMKKAGLNTSIGMGTVFFMLIVIAILIGRLGPFTRFIEKVSEAMKKFFASFKNKSDKTEEGIDKAVEQIVKNETADNADAELVAVIAAAVAAYEGTTDTSGFVVRSIRKIKRQ